MEIKDFNNPVAENATRIINERGYKQVAIATRAGYGPQALNDMLNGRKIIKATDIVRLATALGVTPNELFSTKKPEN